MSISPIHTHPALRRKPLTGTVTAPPRGLPVLWPWQQGWAAGEHWRILLDITDISLASASGWALYLLEARQAQAYTPGAKVLEGLDGGSLGEVWRESVFGGN